MYSFQPARMNRITRHAGQEHSIIWASPYDAPIDPPRQPAASSFVPFGGDTERHMQWLRDTAAAEKRADALLRRPLAPTGRHTAAPPPQQEAECALPAHLAAGPSPARNLKQTQMDGILSMALTSVDNGTTPLANLPDFILFLWNGVKATAGDESLTLLQQQALAALGHTALRRPPALECKEVLVSAAAAFHCRPTPCCLREASAGDGQVDNVRDYRSTTFSRVIDGEDGAARGSSSSDWGDNAAPEGAQG